MMELSSLPRLVPFWWHLTGYQYVCAGILFYVKVFVIGFGIFFSRIFTVWFMYLEWVLGGYKVESFLTDGVSGHLAGIYLRLPC